MFRSITAKINAAVLGLALVTLALAGAGTLALVVSDAKLDEAIAASDEARLAEQLNTRITAVVMESRGIYIARDTAEARRFAQPLEAHLAELERTLAALGGMIAPERRQAFEQIEREARRFVELRRELARVGVEVSPAEANKLGNNDANRANRTAFQERVVALARMALGAVEETKADASRFNHFAFWALPLAGGAVALIFGALIAQLIASGVTAPLHRLTARMAALAEGETEEDVPGAGRADEIGKMAAAVAVFRENALRNARLEAEAGRERERAEAEKRAAMATLAENFEVSIDGVVGSVSAASERMLAVARTMSDSTHRAAERSDGIASASEQAMGNVQTVAAASEEISQSIAEVSARVSATADMTTRAASDVQAAVGRVGRLSESASTIGEVIKLISAIAEQTNLLALNATIEAARAGEAGRGFAVVAAEVKNLASQTAQATEQIAAQITRMQDDTADVVTAIDEIGKAIETVKQSAASIAAAVEEQHAATREIARNATEAASGTRQVSANILDVSSAVGETNTASAEVLAAAQALSGEADRLRSEARGFIARLRAA